MYEDNMKIKEPKENENTNRNDKQETIKRKTIDKQVKRDKTNKRHTRHKAFHN